MTDEQQGGIGEFQVSMGSQDAAAKTEIPLRILVLGDFAPEMPEVADWSDGSRLFNVTTSNFSQVMRQLGPRLMLDVPNEISEKPKEITVELNFTDMKAFRPESIAQQVEELAGLLEIRGLVSQFKDRKLTLQEFNEQIQQTGVGPGWLERFHRMLSAQPEPTKPEPPPPPKPRAESTDGMSALDALLANVDLGDDQKTPDKSSHIENLISAVIQPKHGGHKPDQSVVGTVIADLDRTISDQLNDILHHNSFQQLESAWRGLKLLVDRTDFRENIRIELLAVNKNNLKDAIYHQVFMPEYNELTEMPLSVMIADYEFAQTPADMELLEDIAQMAAGIQAPFIASVGPGFFGSQTGAGLAELSMLRFSFERPEYAKWNALRDREDSQYIALTMPRILLRLPYGPEGIRVKGFDFIERAESEEDYLWGRGAFAVATTLVRSFAAEGWCVQIAGMDGGGVVENLPVWSYHAGSREIHIPLDVSLPRSREKEFLDSGFVLLSSRANDNRACVLSAPTIHRPQTYTTSEETEQARLHATLPYQLFATRMAHYLRRIMQEVSTGLTPDQLQRTLMGKLRLILTKSRSELSPDAVVIEVSDNKEQPDYYSVSLRITPPFRILGRKVDLLLGLQLHR